MPTNDRDPRWTEAYSLGVLQWIAGQPEWSQCAADQAVAALITAGHSRMAASDAVHASRYGGAMSGMLMLADDSEVEIL